MKKISLIAVLFLTLSCTMIAQSKSYYLRPGVVYGQKYTGTHANFDSIIANLNIDPSFCFYGNPVTDFYGSFTVAGDYVYVDSTTHFIGSLAGATWNQWYTSNPNVVYRAVYDKRQSDSLYYSKANPNGYISTVPAQSFASLTGKPTTLAGYGITNAYPLTGNPSGFLTTISSSNVTSALGFTPYNASNPAGYITGITSGNVTGALGFTPYNSSNPAGYISAEVDGSITNELELPSMTGNVGKVLTVSASTTATWVTPTAATMNYGAPSTGNAITSGTAFQPNSTGACNIVINGNMSGIVGLLSNVTIATCSTQNGTYTTVATDQLLITILSVAVDKTLSSIPVPAGYWVKVTATNGGVFTYTRNNIL